jgi:hypothetical protein
VEGCKSRGMCQGQQRSLFAFRRSLIRHSQDLQFTTETVGAIATTAGSIHPYRFVTGILSGLLARHPTKSAAIFLYNFSSLDHSSQFPLIHAHSVPFDFIDFKGRQTAVHRIYEQRHYTGSPRCPCYERVGVSSLAPDAREDSSR